MTKTGEYMLAFGLPSLRLYAIILAYLWGFLTRGQRAVSGAS